MFIIVNLQWFIVKVRCSPSHQPVLWWPHNSPRFISWRRPHDPLLSFQLFWNAKHHCRILVISWSCWPAPRPVVWTTNESAWAIFLAYVSAPPTRLVHRPPAAQSKPARKVMRCWSCHTDSGFKLLELVVNLRVFTSFQSRPLEQMRLKHPPCTVI